MVKQMEEENEEIENHEEVDLPEKKLRMTMVACRGQEKHGDGFSVVPKEKSFEFWQHVLK